MDRIAVSSAVAAAGAQAPEERVGALFDAHYPRLYRLARRLSRSQDDALDLVQDTFVRAAGTVSRIPTEPDAEAAWLVRVLVNLQRDAWRRAQVRAAHDSRDPAPLGTGHPEPALVASVMVWRALGTLPPRRRAVVVMHEIEGLPVRSVATLLGVSAVTVRWHLFRARAELSALLDQVRSTP